MTTRRKSVPAKLNVPTEHEEQSNLFRWADLASGKYPELKLLFAVPNGSHKSVATAMKFKREGLKSGVPDVILPVSRGGYHALFIELKRLRGGKLSTEQEAWLNGLARQGNRVAFCRGFEQARAAIESYLRMGA